MCTTTFPYIFLRFITKRASGITVARRPIPQLTSSNNYLQLSVHVFYVCNVNMTHQPLSAVGHSIRIWKTSFSIQCKFKRCLASGKTFSRYWCPHSLWLVVRRRSSWSPLTANPVYVCIYSPFRLIPRWEVSTKLQSCFQSLIGRNFSENSIFIGSLLINQFSRRVGVEFVFPASRYPREFPNVSQLVSLPAIFFRPGYRQTHNHLFRRTLLSVEGITAFSQYMASYTEPFLSTVIEARVLWKCGYTPVMVWSVFLCPLRRSYADWIGIRTFQLGLPPEEWCAWSESRPPWTTKNDRSC